MALSPDLQEIFPLTFSQLTPKKANELRAEFHSDWGFENLHFFPMLVRQKKYPLAVIEIADYEFLRHTLEEQTFPRSAPTAHLSLDPSVQFTLVHSSAAVLEKAPGVYLLWKKKNQLQEKILSEDEALFLDRLREDQLVYETDLTPQEALVVERFRSLGILKPSF
jgi:hypothetical protein